MLLVSGGVQWGEAVAINSVDGRQTMKQQQLHDLRQQLLASPCERRENLMVAMLGGNVQQRLLVLVRRADG
jgi:hypothetical protein